MVLAGARDYFFLWQLPIAGVFVAAWLVAGPYLTRRAMLRIGNLPRSRSALSRCAQVNFLANGAGLAAMAVVTMFVVVLAAKVGPRWLAGAALVLGPAGLFAMSWATHLSILRLGGRQVLRVAATSAGPLALLALVLMLAAAVPAVFVRRSQLGLGRCQQNLRRIHLALQLYTVRHSGKEAPSLQALVDDDLIEPDHLRCPARPDKPAGYLYAPSRAAKLGEVTTCIRVCDRRGNHGDDRLLLFNDGRIGTTKESDLEKLLAAPYNTEIGRLDAKDR